MKVGKDEEKKKNVAVNSLCEMVSPCLTPLLILIFSLSLCRCTVTARWPSG